jgi:ubiquinone/menaquinone biosynthesis C-methylase UbiE
MRGLEQIPVLYDAMMAVAEATGFGDWRRRLVAGARDRVLDVGCGTGRNLPLYPADRRVVGCDVRVELLLAARRRAPDRPLVVASAEVLPFADGAFDTVVSGLVFCSVPDPLRGLREVRRVLAPEGRLRMLEHVRSRRPWFGWWQDRIQPVWTLVSGGCHPNRDTEATVRAAGFEIQAEGYRARRNVRLLEARAATPRRSAAEQPDELVDRQAGVAKQPSE